MTGRILVLVFVTAIVAGGAWYMLSGTGTLAEGEAQKFVTDAFNNREANTAGAAATVSEQQQQTTRNQNIMQATLHTNMGDITIEFLSDAPNTVANFTKLAGEGFFDGTKFHRVIKGFMI